MTMATDWLETRLQQRRRERLERAARPARIARARKRIWARDMARMMLVASLLMLGVLMVEMGRKAMTVMIHSPAGTVTIG